MPVFSKPQNFTINNSQFTDNATTNILSGPSGIDTLLEASCPDAAHDAPRRAYSPQCFPGTREQYIKDITQWGIPALGETPAPLYWMKGPAGVGKSAIAQTCAEKFKNLNKLGAAFFFSFNGRNKPEKFFPSIAYQLSTIYPAFYELINNKIHHDKTLVNKSMSFQFRYLIDEPLRELESQGKRIGSRVVVIVDGLDECEGDGAQCEIIRVVASAVSNGTLPLCWAFFSRPEPHIEATFAQAVIAFHCHKVILPISRDVDGEIELYLKNGFENILQNRNTSMHYQWPSIEDMEILVGAAGGSFIYATTVIRFVDHLGSLGPHKRLRAIIDIILERRTLGLGSGTRGDMPFAELDAFYRLILRRIPPQIFPSVHLLLSLICQWGFLGAILAANILELSKDEFETVYNHANAVVHLQISGKDLELDSGVDTSCMYTQTTQPVLVKIEHLIRNELGGRISFYHKSFHDFLLDPARSHDYCVKGSEGLAKQYIKSRLDCDRTYCWEGSELVLAPGVTDSASSLSYPYTNELVNSLLKARVYIEVGNENSQYPPSTPGGLGALDGDLDFRKHMHLLTNLLNTTNPLPGGASLWGFESRTKSYRGTRLCSISLAKFNVDEFKLLIKQRERANIIRRYYPDWISWVVSFFPTRSQKCFESALYCMGKGEKAIFWYWEINYELEHYREFRTVRLAEGERIFREEDFCSWPERGPKHLYESMFRV